ncbi:unnamed protein product [Pedinophyceae sp. YPF-701]|nr:unnamed protein product [Pedinophyceae sp. YPF-701]
MSSDCPSNGRRQARHRDRRRARKTRAPDSDLPKLGGGLPAPIVDDAWPKDAHKQPVLLVVNLDGSACVAIDPEREKELHVVEEVPLDVQQQQAELEELRQRGLLRVGCLDLRPRTLVCAILVLCMAGVLVGLLFAFIGVSNTDCFPPACYPTAVRTQCAASALRVGTALAGQGDAGSSDPEIDAILRRMGPVERQLARLVSQSTLPKVRVKLAQLRRQIDVMENDQLINRAAQSQNDFPEWLQEMTEQSLQTAARTLPQLRQAESNLVALERRLQMDPKDAIRERIKEERSRKERAKQAGKRALNEAKELLVAIDKLVPQMEARGAPTVEQVVDFHRAALDEAARLDVALAASRDLFEIQGAAVDCEQFRRDVRDLHNSAKGILLQYGGGITAADLYPKQQPRPAAPDAADDTGGAAAPRAGQEAPPGSRENPIRLDENQMVSVMAAAMIQDLLRSGLAPTLILEAPLVLPGGLFPVDSAAAAPETPPGPFRDVAPAETAAEARNKKWEAAVAEFDGIVPQELPVTRAMVLDAARNGNTATLDVLSQDAYDAVFAYLSRAFKQTLEDSRDKNVPEAQRLSREVRQIRALALLTEYYADLYEELFADIEIDALDRKFIDFELWALRSVWGGLARGLVKVTEMLMSPEDIAAALGESELAGEGLDAETLRAFGVFAPVAGELLADEAAGRPLTQARAAELGLGWWAPPPALAFRSEAELWEAIGGRYSPVEFLEEGLDDLTPHLECLEAIVGRLERPLRVPEDLAWLDALAEQVSREGDLVRTATSKMYEELEDFNREGRVKWLIGGFGWLLDRVNESWLQRTTERAQTLEFRVGALRQLGMGTFEEARRAGLPEGCSIDLYITTPLPALGEIEAMLQQKVEEAGGVDAVSDMSRMQFEQAGLNIDLKLGRVLVYDAFTRVPVGVGLAAAEAAPAPPEERGPSEAAAAEGPQDGGAQGAREFLRMDDAGRQATLERVAGGAVAGAAGAEALKGKLAGGGEAWQQAESIFDPPGGVSAAREGPATPEEIAEEEELVKSVVEFLEKGTLEDPPSQAEDNYSVVESVAEAFGSAAAACALAQVVVILCGVVGVDIPRMWGEPEAGWLAGAQALVPWTGGYIGLVWLQYQVLPRLLPGLDILADQDLRDIKKGTSKLPVPASWLYAAALAYAETTAFRGCVLACITALAADPSLHLLGPLVPPAIVPAVAGPDGITPPGVPVTDYLGALGPFGLNGLAAPTRFLLPFLAAGAAAVEAVAWSSPLESWQPLTVQQIQDRALMGVEAVKRAAAEGAWRKALEAPPADAGPESDDAEAEDHTPSSATVSPSLLEPSVYRELSTELFSSKADGASFASTLAGNTELQRFVTGEYLAQGPVVSELPAKDLRDLALRLWWFGTVARARDTYNASTTFFGSAVLAAEALATGSLWAPFVTLTLGYAFNMALARRYEPGSIVRDPPRAFVEALEAGNAPLSDDPWKP